MTAKEKFEARLEELVLTGEWNKIGQRGRVAFYDDEGGIVLLIHEDESDKYSEIWYPPYNKLRENETFVHRCMDEFVNHGDDKELAQKMLLWLFKLTDNCPLHPVDVYWPADGMSDHYEDFEDDVDEDGKEEEEYQTKIEDFSEFCGWALSTLSYIRSRLYDAVRMELARGHNLPDKYQVENGQDYFLDYSFCYVMKEEVAMSDGVLSVKCYEDGSSFFNIPFDNLDEKSILNIYESMK